MTRKKREREQLLHSIFREEAIKKSQRFQHLGLLFFAVDFAVLQSPSDCPQKPHKHTSTREREGEGGSYCLLKKTSRNLHMIPFPRFLSCLVAAGGGRGGRQNNGPPLTTFFCQSPPLNSRTKKNESSFVTKESSFQQILSNFQPSTL